MANNSNCEPCCSTDECTEAQYKTYESNPWPIYFIYYYYRADSDYSIAKSMQSVLSLHTGFLAQLCFAPSHVSWVSRFPMFPNWEVCCSRSKVNFMNCPTSVAIFQVKSPGRGVVGLNIDRCISSINIIAAILGRHLWFSKFFHPGFWRPHHFCTAWLFLSRLIFSDI